MDSDCGSPAGDWSETGLKPVTVRIKPCLFLSQFTCFWTKLEAPKKIPSKTDSSKLPPRKPTPPHKVLAAAPGSDPPRACSLSAILCNKSWETSMPNEKRSSSTRQLGSSMQSHHVHEMCEGTHLNLMIQLIQILHKSCPRVQLSTSVLNVGETNGGEDRGDPPSPPTRGQRYNDIRYVHGIRTQNLN